MNFKRGDMVRLKSLPTISDFRFADCPDGKCCFVSVRIAGHSFSGYLPTNEVFKVG